MTSPQKTQPRRQHQRKGRSAGANLEEAEAAEATPCRCHRNRARGRRRRRTLGPSEAGKNVGNQGHFPREEAPDIGGQKAATRKREEEQEGQESRCNGDNGIVEKGMHCLFTLSSLGRRRMWYNRTQRPQPHSLNSSTRGFSRGPDREVVVSGDRCVPPL